MPYIKEKLVAQSMPINKLSLNQVLDMYDLFCRYYENVEQNTFLKDLSEKERLFLLKEKISGKIVGFTSLKKVELNINGKKTIGIFSGDTILDKRYWGTKTLNIMVFKYLVNLKLRKPLTKIYWLLISKGYKTYLLLANNFLTYYPRYDSDDSNKLIQYDKQLKKVVVDYCEKLFPKAFNSDEMILNFGEQYQCLKGNVAEITDEMRTSSKKIDFFERVNPGWRKGIELPCIGEISFSGLSYFANKTIRLFLSGTNKSKSFEARPITNMVSVEQNFSNS